MKYIFHCFSLLLLLAAASACGAVRPLANTADSTRVEVRYETLTFHDTAYVELPVIIEKVQTLDTTSKLENDAAGRRFLFGGPSARLSENGWRWPCRRLRGPLAGPGLPLGMGVTKDAHVCARPWPGTSLRTERGTKS